MQHERVLVEDQRAADTEHRRENTIGDRGVIVGQSDEGEAGHEHHHQTENHVVDVHSTGRDIAWPPRDLGPDHPDAEADEQERQDKGE